MGTIYYLWRDDNGTAYELGKLWDLRRVFDNERGRRYGETINVVHEEDAGTLAELIELALFGDHVNAPGEPSHFDIQWMQDIARDIARWSDGKPFRFLDDQAGELERAGDKEEQEYWRVRHLMPGTKMQRYRDAYITGSIYRDRDLTFPRPRNAAEQRRMVGSHYWLAIEMLFHNIAVISSGLYVGRPAHGVLGGYERGLEAVDVAVPVR